MHFLFNLLIINGLYMFRALLAHPQELLHKRHLVYCYRIMSVGCTWIVVELVSQYTDITNIFLMYWLLMNMLYQRYAIKAVKAECVVSNKFTICSNLLCNNYVHQMFSLHRSPRVHPHMQQIKILFTKWQLQGKFSIILSISLVHS
jgi:hypothetical protein